MLPLDQDMRRNVSPMASYFQEISEAQLLNPEDEQTLAWRVQDGNIEARDQMVRANLRFVVAIARRYVGRGLCLSDLIQEGSLGLVHAVERFDPSQNTRFSTYAKYWIQEAIGTSLEKTTGQVRVPAHANELLSKWRKTVVKLHGELGRAPTNEEVAGQLGLCPKKLAIVQKAQRIHEGIALSGSQDQGGNAADELVDFRNSQPGASLTANEEMLQVLKFLDELSPREATVLRLRFGLSGKDPMTLREIGQQLELTRERVRQLENEALPRLRELIHEAA
jgi:RNA polymerase primary sigma factor